MRTLLIRLAAVLLPVCSALAAPADCDEAIVHAQAVRIHGERAFNSENYVSAGNEAGSARIPSIEAARRARACGCVDAVAPLEDATLTAARANVVLNLEGAKMYGARLRKDADLALDALRRCGRR